MFVNALIELNFGSIVHKVFGEEDDNCVPQCMHDNLASLNQTTLQANVVIMTDEDLAHTKL